MAEKKEYKWQVRPGGTFDGNALNIKSATGKRARRGGTGGGSDEKATEEGRRRGLLFFSFFPFFSRLFSPCLVLPRARGATRLPCPPLAPLFSPSARPLSPPCSLAAQAGAVSQHKSLGINKGGESAPAIDAQSLGVAHATNVPDHSFGKTQFAKAEGTPQMDASSGAIAHALAAPKPPASVNAVDKTQVRRKAARRRPGGVVLVWSCLSARLAACLLPSAAHVPCRILPLPPSSLSPQMVRNNAQSN